MEITLSKTLPPYPTFVEGIRRAPDRGYTLDAAQTATALKNALRYIPKELHETLAPEFMEELRTRGRIYGYRYRPQGDLKAKPIDEYKGRCIEGKAFQVMIDNNLCFDIALYPYELVTYGETGQVCQNWMQYRHTVFPSSCFRPLSLRASNVAFECRSFLQAVLPFLLRVRF